MIFGLYRPGRSPLHRAPAGAKLVLLVAAGVASVFVREPVAATCSLVLVLALYLVAGLGPRVIWSQLRPLLLLVLVLGGFQVLVDGPGRAVTVVGVLLALILLATLVTLTTRTVELIDVVVRTLGPLRRVGLDPERIGLALALGVRSVPVILALAQQVREAQLARGLGASPRAFAVPLVVRSLRHADALAEALAARGMDD